MNDIILGETVIRSGLMLAPMAGAADCPMRLVSHSHGAPYAVTEMVSAKALVRHDKKTAEIAAIHEGDTPIGVQIFGRDPAEMAEAALRIATCDYIGCKTQIKPAAIDINMGCPVPKIVKNGEGSALMREPSLVYDIVSACVRALNSSGTNVPLTVKIRAGWNNNRNATEIAKIAEAAGAAMICVHGRTREAMYAPPVDLDIIKAVKESVSIPVIGNGDITSADDALRMIKYTGCDGVAIGRGALGNPWIFEEINASLSGAPYEPPTALKRAEVALRHLDLIIKLKGPRTAMLEARRHLCYYIRGGHGAAALRAAIMKSSDFDKMRALILEFAQNR